MGFCGKSGFLTFAGLNDTTSRQLIKKVHNSRKGKKRVCENSQTRMDSGGDEGDRTPDLLNAIVGLYKHRIFMHIQNLHGCLISNDF